LLPGPSVRNQSMCRKSLLSIFDVAFISNNAIKRPGASATISISRESARQCHNERTHARRSLLALARRATLNLDDLTQRKARGQVGCNYAREMKTQEDTMAEDWAADVK